MNIRAEGIPWDEFESMQNSVQYGVLLRMYPGRSSLEQRDVGTFSTWENWGPGLHRLK